MLDPSFTQRYSTKIAENPKLFVMDEYENAKRDNDMNEWEIITQWPDISMQTNYYSCGIFWFIHRRFPTAAEFTQNDDDNFRLCMIKRILQYYRKGSRSTLYLLNKRNLKIVHDLTEDERNISLHLTTEEIDNYLL
jgi:hypothetical protein